MSDKAIFIQPKNEEELTLIEIINQYYFDSEEISTKHTNGSIHYVGKLKRRMKSLGQKGQMIAVATSFDSYLIEALAIAGIRYSQLEELTYIGESYTRKAYDSIIELDADLD